MVKLLHEWLATKVGHFITIIIHDRKMRVVLMESVFGHRELIIGKPNEKFLVDVHLEGHE